MGGVGGGLNIPTLFILECSPDSQRPQSGCFSTGVFIRLEFTCVIFKALAEFLSQMISLAQKYFKNNKLMPKKVLSLLSTLTGSNLV